MNQFEFDIECEVVSEIAEDVLINFRKKLKEKAIDPNQEDNILIKLYNMAIKLKRSIITDIENEQELEEVKIKLNFINEFIQEI